MQIAINIPSEKAGLMIEVLKNISFVTDISTRADKSTVSRNKREIGILNGVGDVIFKEDWEMTEEELLGVK